jgi:hypothetical protein
VRVPLVHVHGGLWVGSLHPWLPLEQLSPLER